LSVNGYLALKKGIKRRLGVGECWSILGNEECGLKSSNEGLFRIRALKDIRLDVLECIAVLSLYAI
jgi:hypothetical protein